MMLGENDGLKGCAAPPGKPAPALDPLALTRRLAVMPFRGGRVPRKRSVMSTGRAVTFLSGRNCDFSNGDRQRMAGFISNPHVEAPRNDPWTLWREAAALSSVGADELAAANLQAILDHPRTVAGRAGDDCNPALAA
jgi:hypothetical protein